MRFHRWLLPLRPAIVLLVLGVAELSSAATEQAVATPDRLIIALTADAVHVEELADGSVCIFSADDNRDPRAIALHVVTSSSAQRLTARSLLSNAAALPDNAAGQIYSMAWDPARSSAAFAVGWWDVNGRAHNAIVMASGTPTTTFTRTGYFEYPGMVRAVGFGPSDDVIVAATLDRARNSDVKGMPTLTSFGRDGAILGEFFFEQPPKDPLTIANRWLKSRIQRLTEGRIAWTNLTTGSSHVLQVASSGKSVTEICSYEARAHLRTEEAIQALRIVGNGDDGYIVCLQTTARRQGGTRILRVDRSGGLMDEWTSKVPWRLLRTGEAVEGILFTQPPSMKRISFGSKAK